MKSRNKSRFALTIEGWMLLCAIGIVCCIVALGLTIKLEATTLDLDSLKKIVPVGDCAGGEMEEIQKSVWWCNNKGE